ncbi:MAG: hypothetical protein ACW976_06825, partial [Candidatus Ranarchaeia archaeon]
MSANGNSSEEASNPEKLKSKEPMPLSDRITRNTIVLTITKVLSLSLRFIALFVALSVLIETDMWIYTLLGNFIAL